LVIVILAIAVLPSLLVGLMASKKGRSGLGFFLLSAFFTTVVGFIAVLLVSDQNARGKKYARECPFCAEGIKVHATVCPHCQREVGEMQKVFECENANLVAYA
jgi:Ca2+/Na+ antiporter